MKQDIDAGGWPHLGSRVDEIALNNRFKVFEDQLEEINEKKSKESLDEEKRKNNIVIYGVGEANDEDKKKRDTHD